MATEIIAFSQDLAQQLFDSDQTFVVDFDLAWVWLGYATKASAKRKLVKNLIKDKDYSTNWLNRRDSSASGVSTVEQIMLTVDAFKLLGMMAGTDQGKRIREYFLDCERKVKDFKLQPSKYPRQLTGNLEGVSTEEMAHKINVVIDVFFPHVPLEIRTGMKIEGMCEVDPSLRSVLEPHKPKLLLESQLLTPTELGKLMNPQKSAQAVNKLLCEHNLQRSTGNKSLAYELIGSGNEFGKVLADTAKGHGKTIQHVRWYKSVLQVIS